MAFYLTEGSHLGSLLALVNDEVCINIVLLCMYLPTA